LAWLLNDGFVDQVGSWCWQSLDDFADLTWGTWHLGNLTEDLWGSVWCWLAAGNWSGSTWGSSSNSVEDNVIAHFEMSLLRDWLL
jgi:hypothetical protein